MPRVGPFALAACLLGGMAPGCSQSEPAQKDFTLVSQRPAKAEDTGKGLAAAEKACKAETKRKGIASVVGIFSRLRKGAADEDYIACMRGRGYEVKS